MKKAWGLVAISRQYSRCAPFQLSVGVLPVAPDIKKSVDLTKQIHAFQFLLKGPQARTDR